MTKELLSEDNSYSRNFLDKQLREGHISAEEAQDIYDFLGVSGIEDPNLSTKVRDMQKRYPQRFRRPDGDFGLQTLGVIRDLLAQKKEISYIRDDVKTNPTPQYSLENGDMYAGETVNGIKQGIGTYTCKNGIIIRGIWENDTCTKGIISYPDGSKFDGTIETIHPLNARGKVIKNGKLIYEGGLVDGKQSGFGTYYGGKNGKHTGTWRNGERDGNGIFTFPKGHTVSGNWSGNDLIGIGSLTRNNGTKANVTIKNGKIRLAG